MHKNELNAMIHLSAYILYFLKISLEEMAVNVSPTYTCRKKEKEFETNYKPNLFEGRNIKIV